MSETINNNDTRIEAYVSDIKSALNYIDTILETHRPTLNGEMFLTDTELSKKLHISKRTLVEYRNHGKLPYYSFGGKILYTESEILKILEDSRCKCGSKYQTFDIEVDFPLNSRPSSA